MSCDSNLTCLATKTQSSTRGLSWHEVCNNTRIVHGLREFYGHARTRRNASETHVVFIEGMGSSSLSSHSVVSCGYRGTLSHHLTIVEEIRRNSISPAAIITNEAQENPVPLQHTVETITGFLSDIPLLTVPRITTLKQTWKKVHDLQRLIRIPIG